MCFLGHSFHRGFIDRLKNVHIFLSSSLSLGGCFVCVLPLQPGDFKGQV